MRYLACAVAGFILAMAVAQARGLNAAPWDN